MTRTMYDSVTAGALPSDGELYAAYIDGRFANLTAVQHIAAGRPVVKIVVNEATNDGDVFDTEPGNPPPDAAARWIRKRHAQGATHATFYCSRSDWGRCRAALAAIGIDPNTVPPWIADATCRPHLLDGSVATQWWIPGTCGQARGNLDVSSVADFWPGIDGAPSPQGDDDMTKEEHDWLQQTRLLAQQADDRAEQAVLLATSASDRIKRVMDHFGIADQ